MLSGIIAQGSADQGFQGIHYFQSMRLHKEGFGAIVQANVQLITENFKSISPVVSRKLIDLRKSPPPVLAEEILKLVAFKDIKQHTVSTTDAKSQMTIKYLRDVSTIPAVIFVVREVDLNHINYARHNTYQHVYLNDLLRREKILQKI